MPRTPPVTIRTSLIVAIALVGPMGVLACRQTSKLRDASRPGQPGASAPQRAVGGFTPKPTTPARLVFEAGLDTLAITLDTLAGVVDSGSARRVRAEFLTARLAYKRIEGLLRYFAPDMAGGLDGPLPEADEDAPPRPLGSPAGFQIVEADLFPTSTDSTRRAASHRVAGMATAVRKFRALTTYLRVDDASVVEAARLEVARVSTIDLAGVDLEHSENAVIEAAAGLDGIRLALRQQGGSQWASHLMASRPERPGSLFAHQSLGREPQTARHLPTSPLSAPWAESDSTLAVASHYLRSHPDFDRLDRLTFITAYARPAGAAIAVVRASLAVEWPVLRNVWRPTVATVFDSGAFDPRALASDYAPIATPRLIALGRRLFDEPRISGPGTRSCAFCHQPQRAFSDGLTRPALLGPPGNAPVRRTPTLLNAALEPALFGDERAATLEEQVAIVLRSPTEMASSADLAAQRLAGDSGYRAAFADAFAGSTDGVVTGLRLREAIAAYVRTLVALNSRWDRAARGDTRALTGAERHGFNVFMGRARCATCHFAPLFNGAAPTSFTVSEPEIIGVPDRAVGHRATLDPDPGRGGFDHIALHEHAFKVPTLRNIALLSPYMHNGAYATLEQVVAFYDAGGGIGIGADVPLQTLARRPLHLTRDERADLVAFLGALTDTNVTAGTTTIAMRMRQ